MGREHDTRELGMMQARLLSFHDIDGSLYIKADDDDAVTYTFYTLCDDRLMWRRLEDVPEPLQGEVFCALYNRGIKIETRVTPQFPIGADYVVEGTW